MTVQNGTRLFQASTIQQQHDAEGTGLGTETVRVVKLPEGAVGAEPGGSGQRLETIEVEQRVVERASGPVALGTKQQGVHIVGIVRQHTIEHHLCRIRRTVLQQLGGAGLAREGSEPQTTGDLNEVDEIFLCMGESEGELFDENRVYCTLTLAHRTPGTREVVHRQGVLHTQAGRLGLSQAAVGKLKHPLGLGMLSQRQHGPQQGTLRAEGGRVLIDRS